MCVFLFILFFAGGGGIGGGGGNQHRGAPSNVAFSGGTGPRGSGNQNARVYVGNLAWDVAWQVRLDVEPVPLPESTSLFLLL